MKKDEYKCYVCKRIFKKGLTDKEAEEQLKKEFGKGSKYYIGIDFAKEDCELLCDDCYKKMFKK